MSDSVWPHRRQPNRLPCPWDSPGKNTGVGCHFLLQRMKVKSESEVAQLCPTLRDPMDCSLPGSSIHGIFQARVLEWGAIAFSVIACLTMCNVYGGNHNEKLVTTWVTLMTCRTLPLWPSTDTQKVTVQSHALHFPSVLAVTTERMLFVSWWKLSKCGTAESRILWKRWAYRKPKAYEGTAWFVLGTITWTIFPWFINPQQLLLKNPPCMLTRSVRTVVLELIYNRLVTNSSFGIK